MTRPALPDTAYPLCATRPCMLLAGGAADRDVSLPATPVLLLPEALEDPVLPAGFEVIARGVDVDILRTFPVLGLPDDVVDAPVILARPATAAGWLGLVETDWFRSSPLVHQALSAWTIGDPARDLSGRPRVMGIVNVTPDSFSDGGRFDTVERAVARGRELVAEGADILDIGGESTRPGAAAVDADEERARVVPVIAALAGELGGRVPISIDTRKASVARAALEAGATIVNDVSALRDDAQMAGVVASSGASLVLMHMRGQPETMQRHTTYDDLFGEVVCWLEQSLSVAYDAGIDLRRVLVDPGIGFGKGLEENLDLVAGLWRLWALGRPVLLGPSRKRFLGELTGREVTARRDATVASITAGTLAGASVVRVHDVAACIDAVRVAAALRVRTRMLLSPA